MRRDFRWPQIERPNVNYLEVVVRFPGAATWIYPEHVIPIDKERDLKPGSLFTRLHDISPCDHQHTFLKDVDSEY